jgi:hypothetical protein
MPRNVDPSTLKKGSGMANQNSIDANAFVDEVVEGQSRGVDSHVNNPSGAHPASAISSTTSGGQFDSNNVQGNLNELSALVPTRPPTIGNFKSNLVFTGIPDWGELKLYDAGFVTRGLITPPDPSVLPDDSKVYREWWKEVLVTSNQSTNVNGFPFVNVGNDPSTDPVFNVADGGYVGGGVGRAHAGGFTRVNPILETNRILSQDPGRPVVVSGAVYPADRGVLALFHWPTGGGIPQFLAQPLQTRVIAALLCGQGINGNCDGNPGGIFSEGSSDVFSFPGRASGQLDLDEIHLGVNNQTGDPLLAGPQPSAGQVRLGVDPASGDVSGPIPILGGTTAATAGGNDNNFFRYRLPYLANYSEQTGVPYTPAAERPRYFEKPAVSLNPLVNLENAGNFSGFVKDYWTFQVARYRHQFPLKSPPDDQGSYILLHFKSEEDFEAFARDGVMPDDVSAGYELWSASLVNYLNPESTDNIIDTTDPAVVKTSSAYHVLRSVVFEGQNLVPFTAAASYSYDRTLDSTMFVSGVQYFVPNESALGDGWFIDSMSLSISNLWSDSFLLGDQSPSTEITSNLTHRPPVLLYLGGHTGGTSFSFTPSAAFDGNPEYQRIEFDYSNLDSVGGPWDLTSGPVPGDTADFSFTPGDPSLTFQGDDQHCHFWQDARVRAFSRKPLGNQSPASATAIVSHLFPKPGLKSVLFHSTSQGPNFISGGAYGNFTLGGLGNPPRPSLENARKDVEERFLDEVYRIVEASLSLLDPSYKVALQIGNLIGPGLPFPASAIEIPVRVASSAPGDFGFSSYLQNNLHLQPLTNAVVRTEAQVAGLPDRDPPLTDGVLNPRPYSGCLLYPNTDYTTGHRPSLVDGDVTVAQPNYSTITEPERFYLRVFDAAWSNDGVPEVSVVGQPFLTFRIDGLRLSDFAYAPPGPGSALIAIEIKIPGLTTWLDIGRRDGDGPSKQDPMTDGAGCQVIGTGTFDARDPVHGTVYSQVKVHVGPYANIFTNTVSAPGVAPVLMRVRVRSLGASLNFAQGGANASTSTPRALTGVTLLRHSDGTGPTPFSP